MSKRYASVQLRGDQDANTVRAYLPRNYEVVHYNAAQRLLLIAGEDDHGWTLDGYVIPRLGSGMIFASEIFVDDLNDEDLLKLMRLRTSTMDANACQEWVDFADIDMSLVLTAWREAVAQAMFHAAKEEEVSKPTQADFFKEVFEDQKIDEALEGRVQ